MHELSIGEAIATVVLSHAGGCRVESVQVQVGALRQVVPDTLAFCWELIRDRPMLESSCLEIEQVPGVIECAECATRSTLKEFVLRCPVCRSSWVTVVQGEELQVLSIEVADAPDGED